MIGAVLSTLVFLFVRVCVNMCRATTCSEDGVFFGLSVFMPSYALPSRAFWSLAFGRLDSACVCVCGFYYDACFLECFCLCDSPIALVRFVAAQFVYFWAVVC